VSENRALVLCLTWRVWERDALPNSPLYGAVTEINACERCWNGLRQLNSEQQLLFLAELKAGCKSCSQKIVRVLWIVATGLASGGHLSGDALRRLIQFVTL
jgi:hypothetical protein